MLAQRVIAATLPSRNLRHQTTLTPCYVASRVDQGIEPGMLPSFVSSVASADSSPRALRSKALLSQSSLRKSAENAE
jgi:hypothetical protein